MPMTSTPPPDDPAIRRAFEPTQIQVQTVPSHDALPPGTRLGEYEIERVLGEGGFGIVYLATDHGLERHVAIKEYLPAALASRGKGTVVTLRAESHAETFALGLRSFVNEARLLARFDHPSLVRVYRFWEANHTAYMVMPYYEGRTLAATREAMGGPPDEAWLRRLLDGLCGALAELHASSCYHRDIAPDNILILADGRPVLLDFGAARRVIGDRTQTLTAILKPAYAPIEQYAEVGHLQQGPWTDLYALAAVVYYCIAGRSPTPSTVRAVDDQLRPLSSVIAELRGKHPDLHYSDEFVRAIEWALAVRPSDRPQTVADFLRALGEGDTQLPASVRPAAAPPRPAPGEAPPAGNTVPRWKPSSARDEAPPAPAPGPVHARADPPVWRFGPASQEEPSGQDDTAVMAAIQAALQDIPADDREGTAARRAEAGRAAAAERGPAAGAGRGWRWAAAAAFVLLAGAGAWMLHDRVETERVLQSLARPSPSSGGAPETQPLAAAPSPPSPPAANTTVPSPAVSRAPEQPQNATAAALPVAPASAALPPPPPATPQAPPATVAAPTVPATTAATPLPPAQPAATEATTATPTRTGGAPAEEEESARARATDSREEPRSPATPREACGARTQFALYYCMQKQCERGSFYNHPQCQRLRATDEVG